MYSKIRDKYFTIGTAVDPDPKYHSRLVSILINRVMKSGKKTLATRIVNKALQRVEKISKRNPLDVLETAVIKAAPQIQLKSSSARKTRRRTKLVPVEIPGFKSTKIAIKWLVDGTDIRANSGTKKVIHTKDPIHIRLQRSILSTSLGNGPCIDRRKSLHKRGRSAKGWKKHKPMKKKYDKVRSEIGMSEGKRKLDLTT